MLDSSVDDPACFLKATTTVSKCLLLCVYVPCTHSHLIVSVPHTCNSCLQCTYGPKAVPPKILTLVLPSMG